MKLFLDTEFTGLFQDTVLISIGIVSEDGDEFYAENVGANIIDVSDWILDNVWPHTLYLRRMNMLPEYVDKMSGEYKLDVKKPVVSFMGDMDAIRYRLRCWLDRWREIEIWSDCLAYDWVLFCEIFGGAMSIPGQINYIPFDICTVMKMVGVNPDVSREKFAGIGNKNGKHNALFDARVIKACYEKLIEMEMDIGGTD